MSGRNLAVVKTLTYAMFAMFAMTTDSVGLIIPEIVKTFGLTLTAAGTFQYATMAGIAVAGLCLGTLADRLYPTLNSKGISCVPRNEHGAAAGVILFFTCLSAVTAPLAVGALSDVTGQIAYGFWLATALAALLFAGLLVNWLVNPTHSVLARVDVADYRQKSSV